MDLDSRGLNNKLSNRSKRNLIHVDNDLVLIVNKVIEIIDCEVICGHRGQDAQDYAYKEGKSRIKYPNSKHNKIPSLAIDLVPNPINWENREAFIHLAGIVKGIAKENDIKIEWGGDWRMQDLPHYELVV